MKGIATIAFKAFAILMAAVLVSWGDTAGADQITLKATNWFPVGHKQDLLLKEWGQELEKRSGNRITVSSWDMIRCGPAS
jgi:TRAP-type C4-dicarboxylate transport system substrate-binding protein